MRNSGDGFLKNLTIEAEGDGFDSQQVEALFASKYSSQQGEGEESKSTAFAAWTEFGNEIVSEGFGGRNADTNVIAVCGPSYCLLPFGKNLAAEDLSGCIVGKSLAEKLFGSSQAKGQEISWRDRKWKVRDVVCEPSDFVMVQASGIIGEVSFDRISIIPEEKEDRLHYNHHNSVLTPRRSSLHASLCFQAGHERYQTPFGGQAGRFQHNL